LSSWSVSSSQVASNNSESCLGAPLSPIPVCKVHGFLTRVHGSCSILFDIDVDWYIVLELILLLFLPRRVYRAHSANASERCTGIFVRLIYFFVVFSLVLEWDVGFCFLFRRFCFPWGVVGIWVLKGTTIFVFLIN